MRRIRGEPVVRFDREPCHDAKMAGTVAERPRPRLYLNLVFPTQPFPCNCSLLVELAMSIRATLVYLLYGIRKHADKLKLHALVVTSVR